MKKISMRRFAKGARPLGKNQYIPLTQAVVKQTLAGLVG